MRRVQHRSDMVSATVVFQGRVQGVFFRANTKKRADQLGVGGWVRNRPDGAVEAVFEGKRARVKQIIDYCKTQVPVARVTTAKVSWDEPQGMTDFRIKY
jgi:acylphosphatase